MFKISKAQVAHLISVPIVAVFTVGAAWLAKHAYECAVEGGCGGWHLTKAERHRPY